MTEKATSPDYVPPRNPPDSVVDIFEDAVMVATGSAVFSNRSSVARIDEDQYILSVGTLLGALTSGGESSRTYAKVHGAFLMQRSDLVSLANEMWYRFRISYEDGDSELNVGDLSE